MKLIEEMTALPPRRQRAFLQALLAALFAFADTAEAQTLRKVAPPEDRVVWSTLLAGRINPIGIGSFFNLSYRKQLYESPSLALRDNFFGFGGTLVLNPSFVKGGPFLEFSPLTPLRMFVGVEGIGYWGGFGNLQSFRRANEPWDEATLNDRGSGILGLDPEGKSYPSAGLVTTFGADLQIGIGPVVARAFPRLVRTDILVEKGDQLYYDALWDTLLPARGFTFGGDADVLYLLGPFILGARATWAAPLYTPAELGRPLSSPLEVALHRNGPTFRVGPLFGWTIVDNEGGFFAKPTLAVVTGWHLFHPYRAGGTPILSVPTPWSVFVPYVAVAFTAFGDLLPVGGPAR